MSGGQSGPILTVDAVSHSFGANPVLKDVCLEVGRGEIYALLGPNGAGKTTLVRIICGRLKADLGTVRLAGGDPFTDGGARAALGLAPQDLALYPLLSVQENLEAFASLRGLRGREASGAVAAAMAVTRIAERARSQVRRLSGGLQRRANLAAAILGRPSLLVLDEPTVGVDLAAREAIAEALRSLRREGVGVLLVTHDLEQAEVLADRVGVMRAGEKTLEGVPADLIAHAFGQHMEVEVALAARPDEREARRLTADGLAPGESADIWVCLDRDGFARAAHLASCLAARGVGVKEIRVRRPSLSRLVGRAEPVVCVG